MEVSQLWAELPEENQWHSCLERTVDHHFRGKDPQVKQIYELLIARLRELGPLRVDAVKSSINLVSKYHFGGISVRKDYVRKTGLPTRHLYCNSHLNLITMLPVPRRGDGV